MKSSLMKLKKRTNLLAKQRQSAKLAQQEMKKHVRDFKECLGSMINGSSKVKQITITRFGNVNPRVKRCLVSKVKHITFRSVGKTNFEFDYTFLLVR